MSYLSELVSKREVAEGTMAFNFKRPEGLEWKAGQSVDIILIDPPETDAEGNSRSFSVASAPSSEYITIATRLRDTAFKRVLKNAEPGLRVEILGPFGSFTLKERAEGANIMLVGGIGITPFMSMITDATRRGLPHKIYLFYSNRRPEDAAFMPELQDLAIKNPNFKFIPTMTEMSKSAQTWAGEQGYINAEMLNKYVPERVGATYYSAGPLSMVTAMRKMLNELGVSNDDIKTEEFAGY